MEATAVAVPKKMPAAALRKIPAAALRKMAKMNPRRRNTRRASLFLYQGRLQGEVLETKKQRRLENFHF